MSKELKAFRKICRCLNSSYEFTDEYKENKKLIETALEEREELKRKNKNLIYENRLLAASKRKQFVILRIIKENPMFPMYITMYENAYELVIDRPNFAIDQSVAELQIKFDLLKEYFK